LARNVKKLRVLVLVHEDFVAPENLEGLSDSEVARVKTEYDVIEALTGLGHEVRQLGISEVLRPIRVAIAEFDPEIVFNLVEEFQGEAIYDQNVVAYLELLQIPYTGCSPRGLVLTRDKALSKKLMTYHRIPVPRFFTVRRRRAVRRPKQLEFPLIVKSQMEEGSMGIAKASLVHDDEKLRERVAFVHENVGTDAIVEQFIPGREVYVGVLGNERLQILPPQELVIGKGADGPLIATEKVKHDPIYQKRKDVKVVRAELGEALEKRLLRLSKRVYRTLDLEGYARIDYRIDKAGEPFCLEANPNPEIARYEEMAQAAEMAGISYEALLQKILNLGLRR
jgi:D-alanine-D-alanine ligase